MKVGLWCARSNQRRFARLSFMTAVILLKVNLCSAFINARAASILIYGSQCLLFSQAHVDFVNRHDRPLCRVSRLLICSSPSLPRTPCSVHRRHTLGNGSSYYAMPNASRIYACWYLQCLLAMRSVFISSLLLWRSGFISSTRTHHDILRPCTAARPLASKEHSFIP